MYIVYRETPGGGKLYFQTNENDSPKWTTDKSKAKQFETEQSAIAKSDITGLYELIVVKI